MHRVVTAEPVPLGEVSRRLADDRSRLDHTEL